MIDLEALEKLAKAATQGPWHVDEFSTAVTSVHAQSHSYCDSDTRQVCSVDDGEYLVNRNAGQDVQYIAALSPDVVLELIAQVRRLQKDNENLKAIYLADDEGHEYTQVLLLKETARELRTQLDEAREIMDYHRDYKYGQCLGEEDAVKKTCAYLEKYK